MFDTSVVGNINVMIAFIEGLVSFFSPCVIPLLPIYLGYLTGNIAQDKPSRKKSILFTLTFILGIFVALILLNISITWISLFFKSASVWIMRIGGVLIILLGCMQLGLFKIPFFERTFHINYNFAGKRMNLLLAFIMGFTFSFSWTPCIGPALASILILASSSGSFLTSTILVIAYAIGFAVPFLFISIFSKQAITFFQKHPKMMKVIVKVGAVILIVMGILMFAGKLGALGVVSEPISESEQEKEPEADPKQVAAPTFKLNDQFGNEISLSDYAGKVVFLNFWGTWCGICEKELPEIQKLYDKYKDNEQVAIVTMVNPGQKDSDQEKTPEGIKTFLEEKELTFPVLFDTTTKSFSQYGISSFPTVFMINKDQSVFGYLSGGIDLAMMENIIQQTLDGGR